MFRLGISLLALVVAVSAKFKTLETTSYCQNFPCPPYLVVEEESTNRYETRIYDSITIVTALFQATLGTFVAQNNAARAKLDAYVTGELGAASATHFFEGYAVIDVNASLSMYATGLYVDPVVYPSPPTPSDPSIFLFTAVARKVYVRRFEDKPLVGNPNIPHEVQELIEAEQNVVELLKDLTKDGREFLPGVYYINNFENPDTPASHEHEVFVPANPGGQPL